MKDVLDKLVESLSNGNILLGFVIIAVALIFNYKKIVEFFEERKKVRIINLLEALRCEYVTGLTKSHLEDELATEQFKITTGVRLEKQFREAVIQSHKNADGELAFLHFKRALPHLFYTQKKLEIKISTFEIFSYWFNFIFGFVLAFSGLILIVLLSLVKDISFVEGMTVIGLGCFFITVALFMLYQTFSVSSARKIAEHLSIE